MIDWTRVILGVLVCLVVLSLGLWGYRDFAAQYSSPNPAVSERLEQIQQRLSDVETRLGELEKYRQTAAAKESAKDPIDVSTQKSTVPLPRDPPHPPRTQYQVSPLDSPSTCVASGSITRRESVEEKTGFCSVFTQPI